MSGSKPIVFIVDDDASVRRSLSRLMRSAGYQSETFASASEFLASGRHRHSPACLVLDIRMPGLNGLELQERLRTLHSTLAIIFITGHGDIPTSVKAIKDGAMDFLPKPFDDTALLKAIEQALTKSAHDCADRAEIESIQQRRATLTPREREVMDLVVSGMLNKQVGAELGTSEKTIKVHRGRVMEKMQVKSLAELVRLAEKVGIGKR